MPPARSTVDKARGLRRIMTPPEVRLWQILRTRPGGLRFRRQHPCGPYVLDFYCPSARLAIEVDGIAHDMGVNPARDVRRDAWLEASGIRVMRIGAVEVMMDLDAVVRMIVSGCGFPLHRPSDGPPPHAVHGEEL